LTDLHCEFNLTASYKDCSTSWEDFFILAPPLARTGADCIIGHDAALFSHARQDTRFTLSSIVIGDNVTIGATAVIMAGVTIGDGAVVSAGAVTKDTRIGSGGVWGGVPARLIRRSNDSRADFEESGSTL
jgi:acetyltransferase-like isoleucine patch superfamily enzyme